MRSIGKSFARKARPGVKLALLFALLIALAAGVPSAAVAQGAPDEAPVTPDQNEAANLYLPLVSTPPDLADRIGYSTGALAISDYTDIESLRAGWYVDWTAQISPRRPGGMEYVQMVRIHQNMVCGARVTADRDRCPYVVPLSYTIQPRESYIAQAAKANPGSIWLIGNEPDRPDWPGGGQDEILPELYAQAYHHLHGVIKGADPTARVAVAGIIQMTDLREAYLNKMWKYYRDTYGADMPVDVWNVHNFVGSEDCRYNASNELICYGMGVPPDALWGSPRVTKGAYVGEDWRHTHMPTFEAQIRRFRQWMKDHGQQNKDLIVTEYGVLYTVDILCPTGSTANAKACKAAYPSGVVPLKSSGDHVRKFMTDTFDFFLTAEDEAIGNPNDGHRLVQRWAWLSLDGGGYNEHGALFKDADTMSATGIAYKNWVDAHFAALRLN